MWKEKIKWLLYKNKTHELTDSVIRVQPLAKKTASLIKIKT